MLGIAAVLYYRSAGSFGSPTHTAMTLISDLSLKPTWKEGEAITRETPVERMSKTTLGLEISGKIRRDLTDTAAAALWAAFLSQTGTIDIMILDGASTVNGARGFRCDWHVPTMEQDQGAGAVLFDSFTLKPALTANLPQSVLVAGAVPVFTTIANG